MPDDLNEPVLPEDYAVYAGHFYVVDGKVVQSPATGNVAELKYELSATEVRRCDIVGRGLMKPENKQ